MGIGGAVELDLPAALCLDGGPYVTCEVLGGISPIARRVRLSVNARQGGGSDVQIADQDWKGHESRKVSTETLPDGLRRVVVSGELRGPNLDQLWSQVVLPRERTLYPSPQWTVSHRIESNSAGDRYTYELRADENAEPGKFPNGGQKLTVAELVTGVRREVDGQSRLTTAYTFDALITGDAAAVESALRTPIAASGTIVRESFEVSGGRERRLRATYVVTSSNAKGGVLLEWTASIEVMGDGPPVRAVEFEGMRTVLVHTVATTYRAKVNGRAVGRGKFIQAPDVEPPGNYHPASPPTRRMSQVNRHECETTWGYEFVGTAGISPAALATLLPKLAPPDEAQAF